MATKFSVTGDQHVSVDKKVFDIKRQLYSKNGSPLNPESVISALQDIVEGKFRTSENLEAQPSLLKLISNNENLMIEASDGKAYIYDAKKTFRSFIDEDFKNWGLNKPGIATPETLVKVDEIVSDGKFLDIFRALPGTWNQKWFSQDQVIEFCETFSSWLRREGNTTMFLCKIDENKIIEEDKPQDNLVVVSVRVGSDGLRVYVYRLECVSVWYGEYRHRVVSPQLIPSVT
ncbi:MAG: hypothetical protein WC458_01225 [Patescibacteria group bacterium]